MFTIGEKLVTRSRKAIEEAGANAEFMNFGKTVMVVSFDDYLVRTSDGAFTIENDDNGHSWKTFYVRIK